MSVACASMLAVDLSCPPADTVTVTVSAVLGMWM